MDKLDFTRIYYYLQRISQDHAEVKMVANGVAHCERCEFLWQDRALSLEHLALDKTMVDLLAGPQSSMSIRQTRQALQLPDHIKSESLGLPLGPIISIANYGKLRFLWVHAAIFDRERNHVPASAF